MNRCLEIKELGTEALGVTLDGIPVMHLHRWEDDPERREMWVELKSLVGMFASRLSEQGRGEAG